MENIITKSGLTLINRQRRNRINLKKIQKRFLEIMKNAGCAGNEICVLLVSDRTIRKCNRKYRNVNRATDCISFPMQEGKGKGINPQLLGDIIISVDMAVSGGKRAASDLYNELDYLFAHSLLHLLGYDHRTERERKKMEIMENKLLDA
jgi:probable rRNA maturation factor